MVRMKRASFSATRMQLEEVALVEALAAVDLSADWPCRAVFD
jgi:hypothetical protein